MSAITESWSSILRWYSDNGVQVAMGDPASAQDVESLEEEVGNTFPSDLKKSYLLHNGSGDFPLFPYGYSLLSLAEIAKQHAIWMELVRKESFEQSTPSPAGLIKPVWWNEKWIPITTNGGGDHDCVDTDPGPEGVTGQVIEFSHETGPRRVISPSFSAWLTGFANDLSNGKYRYDEDSWALMPVDKD